MKRLLKISFLICISVVLFSCSKYGRMVKSKDYEQKMLYAKQLFEGGKYEKAYPLFEELLTVNKGTSRGPDTYYYYTYCQYYFGDYTMAAHHFENFAKTFKTDSRAEEFQYMNAYCYYLDSPRYTLDQSNSLKAIAQMQVFIDKYSNSTRVSEANNLIDELRLKLEMKDFMAARLYYDRDDYKAAIHAFKAYLKEYPAAKHTEEASFLFVKANYLLAVNSVLEKKEERLKETIETYINFVDKFGTSSYIKEAEKIYDYTKKEIEKLELSH